MQVLRKNSEKHAQIHDLQNKEASLREELTSKTALANYYQEQNAMLERELRELTTVSTTVETRLTTELKETMGALEQCREQLELGRVRDAELAEAATEREEVKNELLASISRLEAVQSAQNDLRAQIAHKTALLEAKDTEIESLSARLNDKDALLADCECECARLRCDADDAILLRASANRLADRLCSPCGPPLLPCGPPLPPPPIERAHLRAAADARARAVEAELATQRARSRVHFEESAK